MRKATPKHARELRQASPIRAAYMAAHPWCELGLFTGGCVGIFETSVSRSEHCHEILSRARGGAIDDPENLKALCDPCHDWVHAHPAWSEEHGFLKSAMKAGAK